MLTLPSRAPSLPSPPSRLARAFFITPAFAFLLSACQAGPSFDNTALDRAFNWLEKVEYRDEQQSSHRSIHVGTVGSTVGEPIPAVEASPPITLPPRAPSVPLKLDASGTGFYSDVQVLLLQRHRHLLCALFTRDDKAVVAGCTPDISLAARALTEKLIDNGRLRVYLDLRQRLAPLHGHNSYRIVELR